MSASFPSLLPADEFLPALLDLSLSGVVCYAPLPNEAGEVVDFRFAYVNPAAQRLLGVPAQPTTTYLQQFPETLANGAFAFHHNAYLSEQASYFDLNYQGGGYDTYCRVAGRRLGSYLVVSFSLSQEQDRNQVEQALRESRVREQAARAETEQQRARLERLFMQAPAAVCILSGPELVYELINPIYQQFFPQRQLLGKPLREALPELADHAAYYTMREVFETGVTKWQQDLHAPLARTDNGELEDRYFNYIQQARYDEHGHIDGVLVFGFEVTEQVLARQQVQRLNNELVTANAELSKANAQLTRTNIDLDTFVYTASHDLKAPIANIEGIVLALREQLPPEVQQDEAVNQLLGLLDHTVVRFQLTIAQLTDLSKLQQTHNGAAEPVLLAAVVQDVRLDLALDLQAAATRLTVEVAPDLRVSFAPQNLRSIVYNLLSNAVKYHSPERASEVRIAAERTPDAVVLTVQDNGLGLTELQQRQLFGLFQRLHAHVGGTGVGLYIVKRLVENVGGSITVQSEVGVGSTFTVAFPA